MKIEYLLIRKQDDFFNTTEQFKNLLRTNERIQLTDTDITIKKVKFSYTLSVSDIKWKKTQEKVFYFSISKEKATDNNSSALEEFDQLLRRINNTNGEQFIINTIWDDVSIYYAEKLYPDLLNIENLLRKIIYRFMVNIAGSNWFDTAAPQNFKSEVASVQEKNKLQEIQSDHLYFADFITLNDFFFKPYPMKADHPSIYEKIKEIKDTNDDIQSKEKQLEELLENYEPKSNWERYFANKIAVNDLAEKWGKLYVFRNKVAHAKRICKKEYDEALKIIKDLTNAFEECLNHVDDVELTEEEASAAKTAATEAITKQIVPQKLGDMIIKSPSSLYDYVINSGNNKIAIDRDYLVSSLKINEWPTFNLHDDKVLNPIEIVNQLGGLSPEESFLNSINKDLIISKKHSGLINNSAPIDFDVKEEKKLE